MPETDPFFEVIFDNNWNACVGVQGCDQYYVDGYLEASLVLIAAVLDKKMYASRDTLAMPILYNTRHALELSLKLTINRLHKIGMIAEKHVPNHDILSHWTHLRNARIGDRALRQIVPHLEPYVLSLARIDNDGQELRYPTNRDGLKSLGNHAVVNLVHVRKNLEAMSSALERLKNRLADLEDEHGTGSYTGECSRADLKVIASALGDHETWKDETFSQKKAEICMEFGLSSRKFSDAVNKIRGSRPLAAMVSLETNLNFLADDKAVFALNQWAVAYPETNRSENHELTTLADIDLADYGLATRNLTHIVGEQLSDEEFSDIEVMFYIGRGREFGEHYDKMSKSTVSKYKNAGIIREHLYNILSKSNLLENVIIGARAVGRPSLATILRSIRPIPLETS